MYSANYYPFGMTMPGRSYSSGEGYRFGFNGKETDKEYGAGGGTQDYGFRMYRPAVGKFLSTDPLFKSYPWYTPYQFAGNKPIRFIDLDGLEEADPLDDPLIATRIILTTYYDIRHSANNLIIRGIGLSGFANPALINKETVNLMTGYKTIATYPTDENGNQRFGVEFVTVPMGNVLQETALTGLDALNVVAVNPAKIDASDFIAVNAKKTVTTQTTKALSEIIHQSTGVTKNVNLPGEWRSIGRSQKGLEYQSYISGKPIKNGNQIEEFNYNGVDFDGYDNGILFDAKDGYGSFFESTGEIKEWVVNSGLAKKDFIDKANNQIAAADGNKLQWIFSDKQAAKNVLKYMKNQGVDVSKIEFKHVPKPSN